MDALFCSFLSKANALFLALDALSCSFPSKTSDSGSNALFLAMDALFCSCLSKASDSDSKFLCLALDSLSPLSTNGPPLTNRVTTDAFGFLNIYRHRALRT